MQTRVPRQQLRLLASRSIAASARPNSAGRLCSGLSYGIFAIPQRRVIRFLDWEAARDAVLDVARPRAAELRVANPINEADGNSMFRVGILPGNECGSAQKALSPGNGPYYNYRVGIRRSARRRSFGTLLSPASLAFLPAGPHASAPI